MSQEKPTGDIGNDLDAPRRAIVDVHLAVRADWGNDQVGNRFAGLEVNVGRNRQRTSVRIDGQVTIGLWIGDGYIEYHSTHA